MARAGPQAALGEARLRSGRWFDPELVGAFETVADSPGFWQVLVADDIYARVHAIEPQVRQVVLETRIITTADVFDAITAERPYRGAIPLGQALEMMRKTVGTALDPACFEALCASVDGDASAAGKA